MNKESNSSSVSPTSIQTTTQSPSEEESESSPWQINKSPPGLQSSVCAKLLETKPILNNSLNSNNNKLDFSAIVEPSDELKTKSSSVPPPPPALPQCNSLSLDINVRTIAAYQRKPKLMYTFRCAQEFRRDEYEWHYRNVHNDIHGGIDGWIEHRCPLWQYGCNFVHRRWNPKPEGSRIVFNELVENFGIVLPECEAQQYKENQLYNISILPFEVKILFQTLFFNS
jgi:F-box protein 30